MKIRCIFKWPLSGIRGCKDCGISIPFSEYAIPACSTVSMYSTSEEKKDRPCMKRTSLPQVLGEIIFGVHPVKLALQAKRRQPYRLYIKKHTDTESLNEIKQLCREAGVKVTELQKNYLNILSGNRPHQGVCLDASKLETDFLFLEEEDIRKYISDDKNSPPLWLLPYSVKDPMNMGSILRSSYFFGVDCVLIPQLESCPLTPVVSKASSGVMEIMNILHVGSNQTTLKFLKLWTSHGGQVIGTSCDMSDTRLRNLDVVDVNKPTMLIIGNEAEGLPKEILNECSLNIYIRPWETQNLDSLNVAVATGIILHSLTKSRQKFIKLPRR